MLKTDKTPARQLEALETYYGGRLQTLADALGVALRTLRRYRRGERVIPRPVELLLASEYKRRLIDPPEVK